ncbi:hypothetical protein ACHAWF_002309, partial [Thalassiosira exigua]
LTTHNCSQSQSGAPRPRKLRADATATKTETGDIVAGRRRQTIDMTLLPTLTLVASTVLVAASQSSAFAPASPTATTSSRVPRRPPFLAGCVEKKRASDRRTTAATQLHLFGNLFGNEVEENQYLGQGELAWFHHELSPGDDPKVKFDSLSIMISEWAKLLADEKGRAGLTTPVTVVALDPSTTEGEGLADVSGVQLLFRKGAAGGRSAYDDKDNDDDDGDGYNQKKKDDDAVKEGGVEVIVSRSSSGDLEVVASRCEIEEGTMVKEMSERTIVDSLTKAVGAWKREQAS